MDSTNQSNTRALPAALVCAILALGVMAASPSRALTAVAGAAENLLPSVDCGFKRPAAGMPTDIGSALWCSAKESWGEGPAESSEGWDGFFGHGRNY